ncbi:PAAR domain-containing protein [Rouxiella sp. WC2420]|uniref:PAAR domain-containing protein n=1 Tax=Rouxiella sp. WC2420 TaxID=3234145 RepID=A0AB39VPL5_9GAMM
MMTRRLAKMGDKTTHGHIISASSSVYDEMKALVRTGDKAWCQECKGSFQIVGTYSGWIDEYMLVGNGDRVACRCKSNQVWATSGYRGDSQAAARAVPVPQKEAAPLQHAQAAKKSPQAVEPVSSPPQPLPLPARIYETQRQMDDYDADDMRYGDLTEEQLKKDFGLINISPHVDPFEGVKFIPYGSHPSPYPIASAKQSISLETSAEMLFDEFRSLSDMFSWTGEYKGLVRKMITHMQYGDGKPFSDPLLNKAMKEQILNDKSEGSTLLKIREVLTNGIDYEKGFYPAEAKWIFIKKINEQTNLPKFNNYLNYINGLVISVHDIWSAHITLESLTVTGKKFHAVIDYRIQDHFGLDNTDINHWIYNKVNIFNIWFVLQRSSKFGFKPFITEINIKVDVYGEKDV